MLSVGMPIFFILFSIFSISISFANEVGNRTFVPEPQAAPIFISKGGTRFWPCNGFVGQNSINVAYTEIVQLSNIEGIKIPIPTLEKQEENIGIYENIAEEHKKNFLDKIEQENQHIEMLKKIAISLFNN